MLRTLSESLGISGFEEPVAAYIVEKAKPYATEMFQDSMGNLYVFKKGTNPKKTVMVCAHTDEVGLLVSSVDGEGYLKFRTVGGIDPGVLLGKRVLIGENRLPGVIGSRAVHLLSKEEKKEKISLKQLYIDIGAESREEALAHVQPGAPVFFEGVWAETDSCLFGKAFDDRAGCYILCRLLEEYYENDLYFVFTIQEETGLRGAQIASRRVCADEYLVVENTTCLDMPGVPKEKRSTALGGGPALTIVDGASFANVDLRCALQNCGVQVQMKNAAAGGNDAGAVSANGKKVAAVSVPCRYLHTPVGVIHKQDLENTIKLLTAYLKGEGVC